MGRSPVLRATRQFDMSGSKKTSWPFGPLWSGRKELPIRSFPRTQKSRLCQSRMNSLMGKGWVPASRGRAGAEARALSSFGYR